MKNFYIFAMVFFIFFDEASAQTIPNKIHFKNGLVIGNNNLLHKNLSGETFQSFRFQKRVYALMSFTSKVDATSKNELKAAGIELFDYLSSNTWLAEFPIDFNASALNRNHLNGIFTLPPAGKIASGLLQADKLTPLREDEVIAVNYFGTVDKQLVRQSIEKAGARIIENKIKPARTFFISASADVVQRISKLPFISFIGKQSLQLVLLNNNNRALHGVDAISSPSGRNLQGKNVTIGMGDNADPSTHIDFAGRLILRNSQTPMGHGTHTTGTAGGAGILNPRYKGMAPKSTLVSQAFNDILVNSPIYANDYHMVLTNNSYFQGLNNCPGDGDYDLLSSYIDSLSLSNNSILHVFACGNDGNLTCSPYPTNFGTIKSGFQTAKNVLSVGAMDNIPYTWHAGSSRGPVKDGRVKPEIMAGGSNITSTYVYNAYAGSSGTSMAAPTVTGALALLYERYRQLHGGADPSGALIKALTCNSADDLGNPGPDFTFGFGMLNVRTATEAMENNQYFSGTITDTGTDIHTITGIPSGAYQLKIMLYWTDQPASAFVSTALVNDLDLKVTAPDATQHRPMVLDFSPANVNNPAVEGDDHLNNIEQVVINNPGAGNFTVSVKGKNIPFGSQQYFVVYQVILPSVTVEYPAGGNTLVPGESENIRWSAYGNAGNSFSVEFSTDNGSSWTMLNNNVAATSRILNCIVPSTATNTGLVRVTTNGLGYSDISDANFTILQQPVLTLTNPCPGYAQLIWPKIFASTQYEIMMLKGDSMATIASTTDTSYLLDALNKDSSYWIGVRALNGTNPGRRSLSVNIIPSGGACLLPAFNNDLTANALLAPKTGRMNSTSQLGTAPIQVALKNLGSTIASGPINISYQVNGGSIITESTTQTIPAGTIYNYTFVQQYDFSAAGNYTIKIWVDFPGDGFHANDTLVTLIRNLQNAPILLSPSFTENFESALPADYTVNTIGLDGLDRCDFFSTPNGRVRTFVNTGFARSGNRCVTLDQHIYSAVTAADSLVTTFNLSNYSATDQIWLDYFFKKQLVGSNLHGNGIWIRGNDQSAWVFADSIYTKTSDLPNYKAGKSIDVSGILANALPAQSVSSSFQVKFGQEGYGQANDVTPIGYLDAGLSFDDVTLTKSAKDVGMISIDQPIFTNLCGLSNAEAIQVKIKNYSTGTLNGISVTYSLNGQLVTETIPVIAAGQTISYSFTQKADLSAYQEYNLRVWIHLAADNYNNNDSLETIVFHTVPLISAYPYLEGFESDNGHWYSQGTNDSWEWGTPSKSLINRAASGKNAWVTGLNSNYNDNELSYLYSPCFDVTSLNQPMLSFSHIFRMEDDCACDYHWVEYSTDNIHWTLLDGAGTNWYDDLVTHHWSKSNTKWHVSSVNIPVKDTKLRFRFVIQSDPATNYEGVGIDDIHVFDKAPIYDSSNINSGLSQPVSGSNWINFDVGGKRIASINPNGQDLGNTLIKVAINRAAVRDSNNQYYLDRNLVIQPTIQPQSYVLVRYYFTDSEAVHLINASGCSQCTTIGDAYLSGVTQYSSTNLTEEDSTLANNKEGHYAFLTPQQDVSIVPYDNGYYAQYIVYSFSEFWINGGGPGKNQAIPALLDSFAVVRVDSSGDLTWHLFSGALVDSFVIQKSTDALNFLQSIASIKADSTVDGYEYIDHHLTEGLNYYRIKIITPDGNIQYSAVRVINYTKITSPTSNTVYPNPVRNGRITVKTVSNCNRIALYDVLGRFVHAENKTGTDNIFTMANLSKGVYFLRVNTDTGNFITKLVVE